MYGYDYSYTRDYDYGGSQAPPTRRWLVALVVVVAALAAAAGWYAYARRRAAGARLRVTPLDSVVHADAVGMSGTWVPAWQGSQAFVSDTVAPATAAAARKHLARVLESSPRAYVSGVTRIGDDAFEITYAPALGRRAASVRVSPATASATPRATSAAVPVPATLTTGTFANFSMVSY
jgi:hypothetical protein